MNYSSINSKLNFVLAIETLAFYFLGLHMMPNYLKQLAYIGIALPALAILCIKTYKFWALTLVIPAIVKVGFVKSSEIAGSHKTTIVLLSLITALGVWFSLSLLSVYLPISHASK